MELGIGTEALLWGLGSAVSLPLGAMLGLWWKPRRRLGSAFTAFGAGALLFALTIELFGHVPHHVEEHGYIVFLATLVGAVSGGVTFDVLNQYLNNRGAFLRRLSSARSYVFRVRMARTHELVKELSRVDVLRQVPPELMAKLIDEVEEECLLPGHVIFRQGDEATAMYFIVSGEVEILRHNGDGPETTIACLGANDTFGEMSLLRDAPRSAGARARTNVHAYKLNKSDFDIILAESPDLQRSLKELTDNRIDALSNSDSDIEGGSESWRRGILQRLSVPAQGVTVKDIMSEGAATGTTGAAMAIWLGILIDGIPESLVIGMLTAGAAGMSLSFIAGVFLANLPEAMSSAVSMRSGGMGIKKIMLMWGSICILTGLGAFLGAVLIPANPEGMVFYVVLGIEAFAAGAMLTMIAETMLPEAFEHGGAIVGLSTLAGFLTTLFVKIL
ncbi:MAG: cyclic nucleotide-binding domain-containing protein [Candidatus Hydrogenedentes bacterium]|nr:cyclic nucleotide-binding domain-containing protein [Candidatus Hydrogenedentota bacterium]